MGIEKLYELRQAKLKEIRQLLAVDLGIKDQEELSDEADEVIDRWAEDAEMQDQPPEPSTPLQRLLKEHYELGEQILNIQDDNLGDG
jgi:hypothetical protein